MATVHIQIDSTTPRVNYAATSGQTSFEVPFTFFDDEDLQVYQNDTLLTLTTHYTVSGAGDTGGGTLTLVTGATLDDSIVIIRSITIARVTDLPSSGAFVPDDANTEFDRIVAMMQQIENSIQRTLRLNDSDTTANVNIPAAADRASKFLAFDSDGDPIVSAGTTEVTVSSFMETVLDDTTAAAARTTLGITDTSAHAGLSNFNAGLH